MSDLNERNIKKYRILMIAPRAFYVDVGFSVQILEEYKALKKMGNELLLTCYHLGDEMEGVDISRALNVPWYKDALRKVNFNFIFFDFLLLIHTFKVARKYKPDVLHAHIHEGGLIGIIVGKILNIPVALDIQGSMLGEYKERGFPLNPIIEKAIRFLEKFVNSKVDGLLVEMEHRKNEIIGDYKINEEKIFHFKMGVDTDHFTFRGKDYQLLKKMEIPQSRKIIGYIGLVTQYQGIDLLLEAMKFIYNENPDVHLIIMGYMNLEFYKNKAIELGISDNVTFTGKMPYLEAPKYLSLCDIAVGPKISIEETNGKLIPYMSMGLPTVAFDTSMNREYLGEFGIYAKYKNSEDLAKCMLDALKSEKSEKFKEEIRNRAVKYFSLENMALNTMKMYDELTK